MQICPFRYVLSNKHISDCIQSGCQAWDSELKGCVLLMPFKELAECLRAERLESQYNEYKDV